jgi:hypothetical protein
MMAASLALEAAFVPDLLAGKSALTTNIFFSEVTTGSLTALLHSGLPPNPEEKI